MLIRKLNDCKEFEALDGSTLRELLNAEEGGFAFNYSLAHAAVGAGQATKPHRLKFSEVYYIYEGGGIMHIENEAAEVCAGSVIYIPPGSRQYIENRGSSDLKFLCIVDPPWRPNCEIE